jgi:hypothetical protein
MKIELNDFVAGKVPAVTSVILLKETAWIDFSDKSRIYLTIDQLKGIVEHYERALDREQLLAKLGN